MKLYIKQRIFSIRDKYDIYDENQRTIFYVESELFSFMSKIHLYDHLGNEQFFIKQNLKFLLSEYEIYKNNILCAKINQRFSFLKGKLDIGSSYGQFHIEGNFLGMEYTIYHNGNYYGSLSKKWLSWGDSYELDIAKEEDAAFICALVVAVDHCMHNQKRRSNN